MRTTRKLKVQSHIELLKHADASDSRKKFGYAQTIVHSNQDPNSHSACVKSDIEIPVIQYHLIDEDIELYPGIEFISFHHLVTFQVHQV